MESRQGAVILLENEAGQIAFQLRDNRPDIAFPDHWGLFGGWMEKDELPSQTIIREIQEELGLVLDLSNLTFLTSHVDGDVIAHVFYYLVGSEKTSLTLYEGQELRFMKFEDLQAQKVVPRHHDIMKWYKAKGRKLQLSKST